MVSKNRVTVPETHDPDVTISDEDAEQTELKPTSGLRKVGRAVADTVEVVADIASVLIP